MEKENKHNNRNFAISLSIVLIFVICLGISADKLKNKYDTTNTSEYKHNYKINRFGYDGHDYIEFFKQGQYEVIHDPNCHCHSQE